MPSMSPNTLPKSSWKWKVTSFAGMLVTFLALAGAISPASAQGKAQGKAKAKHYAATSTKAVDISRAVLVKQGYDVVRVERVGATQVLYYRRGNNGRGKGKGPLEKLVIRTVKDRVVFEDAAPDILVAIDIKLGS
jgi:hypothetical protein